MKEKDRPWEIAPPPTDDDAPPCYPDPVTVRGTIGDDLAAVKANGRDLIEDYGLTFTDRRGAEWKARCPFHFDTSPSLRMNAEGLWFCDPCGIGGTIVDFVMRSDRINDADACAKLLRIHGQRGGRVHTAPLRVNAAAVPPTTPVPAGTPEPDRDARCTRRWLYVDANGGLLGGVDRIEDNKSGTGGKRFLQWRWNASASDWEAKGLTAPRPLYGLVELHRRPDAPVLVVEGEKAADAAREIFPGHVCVASMGGSNAARSTDWTPLEGRNVTAWPDNDEPGAKYVGNVAAVLAGLGVPTPLRSVAVPSHWPKGWDLADELPEGVTGDDVARLLDDARTPHTDEDDWPDPEPLPDSPPFPSLLDDCGDGRAWIDVTMPPDLAHYLRGVAASKELAPETMLVSALSVVVLAIGPNVLARGLGSHLETLSTWDMAVLPPASRKSAGFAACQAPLSELETRLRDEGRARRAVWSARETARAQEEGALGKRLAAYFNGAHGEGRNRKGEPPPSSLDCERFKARLAEIALDRANDPDPGRIELQSSNATPEAVVERVATSRCFAMLSPEGATILEGLAEYRGGDDGAPVGHWCSLHTGDPVTSTRTSREPLIIPAMSAVLCCGITVQPDVLARARENRTLTERGFLARFTKYFPRAVLPCGDNPPLPDPEAERWWNDTIAATARDRPEQRTEVSCSPEAVRMLRGFEIEMRRRAADLDDLGDSPALSAWAGKAHGTALRKAVIFHVLQDFTYAQPVSASTLAMGIAMARMGLATEIALDRGGDRGKATRLHRVLAKIQKSGVAEITPRTLAKDHWCGFKSDETEAARAVLRSLAELRWLREEMRPTPGGGPSQNVFVVSPRARNREGQNPCYKRDRRSTSISGTARSSRLSRDSWGSAGNDEAAELDGEGLTDPAGMTDDSNDDTDQVSGFSGSVPTNPTDETDTAAVEDIPPKSPRRKL